MPSKKSTKTVQEQQDDDIKVVFETEDQDLTLVNSEDDFKESDFEDSEDDDFEIGAEHIVLDSKALEKIQTEIKAMKQTEQEAKGVVYVGRIPHGFYEQEMKAYFSQFGEISRLRLSRNKKTGKSKHYAFIEFESQQVAKIVADTMNNYLMFGHLLKCKYVEPENVHPATFNGANRRFRNIPWASIQRSKHNKPRTDEQQKRILNKLIEKENIKRQKLSEMGIDYDFPGYSENKQTN